MLQRSPDGTQLYIVEQSDTVGVAGTLYIFDIIVEDEAGVEGPLRLVDSFDLSDGVGGVIEAAAQVVVGDLGRVLVISESDGQIVAYDTNVEQLLGVDEDSGAPIDGVTAGTLVSSFLVASDADGDSVGIAIGGFRGDGIWHFSTDGGTTWELVSDYVFETDDTNLLLLGAASQLYYEPAPDESGDNVAALTYLAWDGRDGFEGESLLFGSDTFGDTVGVVHAVVNPANDPVIANDDNFNVIENSVLSINVVDNDFDADFDDQLTVSLLSDVVNGNLIQNGIDGSFTYTPDEGFIGSDSFTYEVTDGGLTTDIATVTLPVSYTHLTLPTICSV